ncbi:TetR/AcrR family transcriptional regulator [Pseudochelatococcus sp. B33]
MTDRKSARSKSRSGRPTKQEAKEPTSRILETALGLFASRGFAGTSVEQVAAACGAGKDTIYRRFPSKAALFEGVVEYARNQVLERVRDLAPTEGDVLTRLQSLLRLFLAINMERDLIALKRITLSEAIVFGKQDSGVSQPDPLMEKLIDAVSAAQAGRFLRAGDPAFMAAYLIHSLVSVPTTRAMLGGSDYDAPEALDAYFGTVWNWLIDGLAEPQAERLAPPAQADAAP